MPPLLGLFLSIGALFSVLAAACAYLIAYHEYRQRMLLVTQNPKRMALDTALVTFAFMMIATVVLYFALRPVGSGVPQGMTSPAARGPTPEIV
jgi:hypothetical protein